MGARRLVGAIAVLPLVFGAAETRVGALSPAQRCSGPAATTQAGRITLQPGLSARALKQTITFGIHLFSCTAKVTNSSGNLRGTYTTPAPQTCALLKPPHTLNVTLTVQWKSGSTSTLGLALSFAVNRLINISGNVTGGVFKGHAVSAQYSYRPVINPNNNSFATACADTKAVGLGRISVIALNVFLTKAFRIV